jgi:hypothetical protein
MIDPDAQRIALIGKATNDLVTPFPELSGQD